MQHKPTRPLVHAPFSDLICLKQATSGMASKTFIFVNNNDAQDGDSLDQSSEGGAGFTFVHTSGAPELSKPAAKLMRGHVTKVNFAKRRQSNNPTGKKTAGNDRSNGGRKSEPGKDATAEVARRLAPVLRDGQDKLDVVSRPHPSSMPGLPCHEELVSRYMSLAYSGEDTVTNPPNQTEAMWHSYFEAEPALVDAALAIAFRKWQPDPTCANWTAEMYSHRAISQLIRRMESPGVPPENILAVVTTMLFSARLAADDAMWEMHGKGVVGILTQRCGQARLPWFNNLLLLDSMNYVFNFPRMFYSPVIPVLAQRNPEMQLVLQFLDGLIDLRTLIASHRSPQPRHADSADIEERASRLRTDAGALRFHETPCIQIATRAGELLLELMWPSTLQSEDKEKTTTLAEEIRILIQEQAFRTCIYNDLTSCTFMLGAIGARRGSPTRSWFVEASKKSARQLKAFGWVEPIRMLEPWLATDMFLMDEIRGFMDEVAAGLDQTEDDQKT
ncbi:unnamed protein product [Clonostachys rosea]|uniref:Transcription factor domain-containing protein n=1 Tax=Bionectria ochroleuca TaxID=29856 RepID=A0ABY6UH46_BIOOC|nr:unnamed protein product [Clonostachys rosea]